MRAAHSTIRILLVDDHRMVREGLCMLLASEPDLRVVGQASDGLEALRLAQELRPDLVVMDVVLSGLNGVDAARRLQQVVPGVRVLMLSMHEDGPTVGRALRAGVRGYVVKDGDTQELFAAIRCVHRGEVYLSEAVDRLLPAAALVAKSGPALLTAREEEVLALIAEGLTARQVGRRLGVSPKTAENHRANIKQKLGIRTTAGLVRWALETRRT